MAVATTIKLRQWGLS